ncbi:MAG TPA: helix-turn-helix domain-containing protein [Candidatus Dormibacteraeota bacterium]|nr:helix-turn-helix domain-containing protein [Candidatus Dormibacteraeota bacterium]
MAVRSYGQYCGLARAMDMVGERWALLVIRDLVVGPKRFSDLHRGLPRIPTNILTTRLRQLEGDGVIARRLLPRPSSAVVYELTDYGRDLEEIVMRLGRWGARSLTEPASGEIVTAASLVVALRSTFCAEAARRLRVGYEIHLGDVAVHARVDRGRLEAGEGPLAGADLVIEASPAIRALFAGELSPGDAIESGAVRIQGPPELLDRFVEVFHIPAAPAPPGTPAA